jgi:hypothetical protein
MANNTTRMPAVERRAQKRGQDDERWRTALTCIEPNKIIVRGYPLDELMGRLTFGEAIYLRASPPASSGSGAITAATSSPACSSSTLDWVWFARGRAIVMPQPP